MPDPGCPATELSDCIYRSPVIAIEIIGGSVVVVLAVVTTAMTLEGGLGVFGALTFDRCKTCRRLPVWPRADSTRPCVRCRLSLLFSKVHTTVIGLTEERSD